MNWHIRHAAHCIRNGGVIAYPTETVYGLGCDPLNAGAVMRLLSLKQRNWKKGLILVASNLSQVSSLIQVENLNHLADTINQEADVVSWVVPAHPDLPLWIRGEHDTVAIRISRHQGIIDLCNVLRQAIISTSANPSTCAPAQSALQVRRYFDQQIDYVLHSSQACDKAPSQLLLYPSRQRLR